MQKKLNKLPYLINSKLNEKQTLKELKNLGNIGKMFSYLFLKVKSKNYNSKEKKNH